MLRAVASLFGPRRPEPQPRQRLSAAARPALIYAIGDVHGCLDELLRLEQHIVADAAGTAGEKWIVMLGDYVDRGPASAQVIDHLLAPPPPGFRRFTLAGNHEQMLLEFLAAPRQSAGWLDFGGLETLRSYGIEPLNQPPAALATALAARLPSAHLDWLHQLPASLEVPGFVFVHAGLRPGVPLDAQDERDMLWIRNEFLDAPASGGPVVVHGHSPEAEPVHNAARIGIDTAAFATGRLTSARIDADGGVSFITSQQANPMAAA